MRLEKHCPYDGKCIAIEKKYSITKKIYIMNILSFLNENKLTIIGGTIGAVLGFYTGNL